LRALLAALLQIATPAVADDWLHYINNDYGFELDIPPGYIGRAETATPEGQFFQGDTSDITVSALPMEAADFEAQVLRQQRDAADAGWNPVFLLSTPQDASFGGQMGAQRLWVGLIPICSGKAIAEVRVTYGKADAVPMQRPVSRMERSMRDTGTCSAI
jgi:hypothetical protein